MIINWSREAIGNLNEIKDYISINNPQRAKEFLNYIFEQVEILKISPDVGRIVPELINSEIRELIIKSYRIVYQKFSKEIKIYTVFESHKQLPFNRPHSIKQN